MILPKRKKIAYLYNKINSMGPYNLIEGIERKELNQISCHKLCV